MSFPIFTRRTSRSLVQYLGLHTQGFVALLFDKHGISYDLMLHQRVAESYCFHLLSDAIDQATQAQLVALVDEVVCTKRHLGTRIDPSYVHDERFADLERCLLLDGYAIKDDQLVPQDPTIIDTQPVEDDLSRALAHCTLQEASAVAGKLKDSTDAFRRSPPDLNASLNSARVALQMLATAIAKAKQPTRPGKFEENKWGSVLAYLRLSQFITEQEEKGLAGVFGFVSPGSHVAIGPSDLEMARIGRSFVCGMCWFLVKRFMQEAGIADQ